MMRDTSLLAYESVKPTSASKRDLVYAMLLQEGISTDQVLAFKLGWPINTVTPRRNELVKLGEVELYAKLLNGRGKKVCYWRVRK